MSDISLNLYAVDSNTDYLPPLVATLKQHFKVSHHIFRSGEQFLQFISGKQLTRQEIHVAIVSFQFSTPTSNIMNGLEILETIHLRTPIIATIMLAQGNEIEYTQATIKAGALAVIPRTHTIVMRIINVIVRYTGEQRVKIRRKQFLPLTVGLVVAFLLLIAGIVYYALTL